MVRSDRGKRSHKEKKQNNEGGMEKKNPERRPNENGGKCGAKLQN